MSNDPKNQILRYAEDQSAMVHLARASHLGSANSAADAHLSIAPSVIEELAIAGTSPETAPAVLVSAQGMTWAQRSNPVVLFENEDPAVGRDVSAAIFGSKMPAFVSKVATATGSTAADAGVLIDVISAVALAVMAGDPVNPLSGQSLAATLTASAPLLPNTSSSLQSTGALESAPAVDAAAPITPAQPVPDAAPITPVKQVAAVAPVGSNPDGGQSKTGLLVGGAVALLALLGLGFFALGGNNDGVETAEPDSLAFGEGDDPASTPEIADEEEAVVDEVEDEVDPDPVEQVIVDETVEETDVEDDPVSAADNDQLVSLSIPMEDITNGDRDASGVLNFDFDTESGEVCYSVESMNIEGPYRSHIHVGGEGVSGGIVVDLGPLVSGDIGCVDNLPIDTNAILADRANHYAELHDISEEWTIRGQLSEAVVGGDAPNVTESTVDAEGGGASIVLDGGTVYLEGAVPDQATADEMAQSLSGIDAATPVVNNLSIDASAPLPSGRVVIADAVFFAVASDEIRTIDEATLNAITALALSRDDWILTVVGHTDSEGSDVTNLELSLRRATSLRDLLASLGVPDDNLRIRGAGETAPIGDNATAEGRAQNRRIEFEFTPRS